MDFAEEIENPRSLGRLRFPIVFFLQAIDPALAMHSPYLFIVAAVAKLAQRNLELNGPGRVLYAGLRVPNSIPVYIGDRWIGENQINLLSYCRNIKLKPSPMIMIAVEIHA